jgi:prephenate dehydratase
MAKLAFFGPPGTNTEEAALKYKEQSERKYNFISMASITAVGTAVEAGMAEEGVVPIENSLEGSVAETLDLLIHVEKPLYIRHEIVLPIQHYLLARPGMTADSVKVITSMPQALAQCRGFIERCFPKARVEAALSTAAAVEEVMGRDDAAAIGTRRAAELYGAEILAEDVQDRNPNVTRFVVIGREDHARTGDDKTSVAFGFATEDRPGLLVAALQEFAGRDINLSKIESRPSKERLGTYIFLVDIDGHRTDKPVSAALEHVEELCSFFRILGSYPRFRHAARASIA